VSSVPRRQRRRGGDRGQIAEQDLAQVKAGQRDRVPDGHRAPFTGQVRLLGAIIDPQTRLAIFRIQLKPDPRCAPPFAPPRRVSQSQRPVLPQTAVMPMPGAATCWSSIRG